jgi:hypothetical protein
MAWAGDGWIVCDLPYDREVDVATGSAGDE